MVKQSEKRQTREGKNDKIDRLSSLPDSILVDILALLPLKSAVKTSVLSQRWRYLWTQLTHLVFDPYRFPPGSYLESVNSLFPQFTSPKIHSLHVQFPYWHVAHHIQAYCSSLESWIAFVCGRHVERVELTRGGGLWSSLPPITLPICLFQSQSLANLTLKGSFDCNVGLSFSLPNLKILHMEIRAICSELLAKLFKSSPLLEELSLLLGGFKEGEGEHCLDLSTLNLKKVHIRLDDHQQPVQARFVINSSRLEEITLRGLGLASVSFVKRPSALIKASLFCKSGLVESRSNTLELAGLLSRVCSLDLNSATLKSLVDLDHNGLILNSDNLKCLKIEMSDFETGWNDVLLFLRCSPNLEDLTVRVRLTHTQQQALKWVEPDFAPPCGLTNVKRIVIQQLEGYKGDLKMMEYILRNAQVLKLLSVHVHVPATRKDLRLWKEYVLCEKLFLLQSCSSSEIQFSGFFIHLSSKGDKNSRPRCQSMRLGDNLVV